MFDAELQTARLRAVPARRQPVYSPTEDAEDAGLAIREIRTAQQVSVAELARRAGVSERAVREFEAGRVIPPSPGLELFSRALGRGV